MIDVLLDILGVEAPKEVAGALLVGHVWAIQAEQQSLQSVVNRVAHFVGRYAQEESVLER